MKPLNLLVKFPSRNRPDRFFKSLDSVYATFRGKDNFHVSCTLDTNDLTMNNPEVIDRIRTRPNISIEWGVSNSKIEAVNRSMPDYSWDVILILSDDMLFTFEGVDDVIRGAFEDSLDWLLHIPDNDAKSALATMYIAGKDFYKRFGYCYNPIYSSLFCDNAIQDISKIIGRYKYLDFPGLIFHANPAYGHQDRDSLFDEQQKIGWSIDQQTYEQDRKNNFGLEN